MNSYDNYKYRSKIGQFFKSCKSEIIRAAKLGQTMLGAGLLNDQRSTIHRDLGEWLIEQIESGKLNINSDYVKGCSEELKKLDGKIQLLDREISELKSVYRDREDGVAP